MKIGLVLGKIELTVLVALVKPVNKESDADVVLLAM
jgi:hypothetical protein